MSQVSDLRHVTFSFGGRIVRVALLGAALLAGLAFNLSSASAQERPTGKLRLGVGMVLDFAGGIDDDIYRYGVDSDAKLTPGLRGHVDYQVHKHVSVGGFARLSFWEGQDIYEDRSLWFDIGPRLKGHYDWRDFRFYVAFMPGLTLSRINDDGTAATFVVDNPGIGATVSLTPGVEWWFSRDVALYSEIFGWTGHYFSHDANGPSGDFDFSVNQVAWNIGAVFDI